MTDTCLLVYLKYAELKTPIFAEDWQCATCMLSCMLYSMFVLISKKAISGMKTVKGLFFIHYSYILILFIYQYQIKDNQGESLLYIFFFIHSVQIIAQFILTVHTVKRHLLLG